MQKSTINVGKVRKTLTIKLKIFLTFSNQLVIILTRSTNVSIALCLHLGGKINEIVE